MSHMGLSWIKKNPGKQIKLFKEGETLLLYNNMPVGGAIR